MSMLTLQVLALLLLFGLIGAFLGWLIRPFFCKPGTMGGRGNLSGSAGANANAKMSTGSASIKTAQAKTSKGGSGDNTGNGGKIAAAAGIAAAAATAAAVSSSNKKGNAAKAKADQAAKQTAAAANKKKLAAEADKAKAAKIAEQQRIAAEKVKAAKLAEAERAAAEKAKADQAAKDAAAKAQADKLAAEKAKANQAAKADAIEADKKKLAAQAETARKAEADRLAAEKAKADQIAKDAAAKAEADRLAAEKAKADQAAKDAAAKAQADKLAAEKAKADQAAKDAAAKAEADRIAAEQKAKADQAAKDAAAKAEADRIAAEQKAKADQAAKDAAAKAEADRIAAEQKAKADQAAKDAAAKAEADRIAAEQKAKADQAAKDAAAKAEADRIAAEQKAKADQAAKDAAAKAEADRIAAEQKAKADQAAKDAAAKAQADKANAAKLAAAAAATVAATVAVSGSDDDDLASVTDDMRPERLTAARGGNPDDLKRIKGIGPVIEGTLNEEGVYHFQQIADFTPDNVKWVDKNVSIPGRVHRDDWIGQAKALEDNREYDGYAKDIAGTDDPSLPPVTEDMRPAKLSGPNGGKADDLKKISGIGPVIEKTLNAEGIYHFKQIADFTPDNVNWVDRHISFPGRITREEWIRQAKGLDAGGDAGSGSGGDVVITDDMRPARRSLSAGDKADDLKVINGIGPVIEKSLNDEGVYFYQQIADFDDDNTKWVDNHMAFPGRIHREEWIPQAKVLVGQKGSGGSTGGTSGSGAAAPAAITVTEDMRPARRTLGAGDKADDLKVINGIGPVIEDKLNEEGVYFYQQIADFDDDNTKWVDNHMAFPGRIHREEWIPQAKVLVGQKGSGGSTGGTSGSGAAAQAAITVTEDMRPTRRTLSSGEKADDLKVINGIGPVIEDKLNAEGVYFYQQIADFDDDNTKWVDNHMTFPGRIHREEWIPQAKVLVGQKGSGPAAGDSSGSANSDSGKTAKPLASSAVGSALGSSGAVPDDMKPTLLSAPEGGKADDLKRIKGIGKVLQKNLHEMGIYHYEQLAALTPDNIKWLTDYVSFPEGRIDDEKWISQAKALAEGKQTEYSQRFDKGDTPYK